MRLGCHTHPPQCLNYNRCTRCGPVVCSLHVVCRAQKRTPVSSSALCLTLETRSLTESSSRVQLDQSASELQDVPVCPTVLGSQAGGAMSSLIAWVLGIQIQTPRPEDQEFPLSRTVHPHLFLLCPSILKYKPVYVRRLGSLHSMNK